jgi:hypothetical protein
MIAELSSGSTVARMVLAHLCCVTHYKASRLSSLLNWGPASSVELLLSRTAVTWYCSDAVSHLLSNYGKVFHA